MKLEDADTAGVLAVLPGIVGMLAGGWGLWAGLQGLRLQRTPEVIASEIAQAVLRAEGSSYRQLLGSGQAAPGGHINLAFSVTPESPAGQLTGTQENIAAFYRQNKPDRTIITGTSSPAGTSSPTQDAGAGKTVLALTLLIDLIKERQTGNPVPVRLSASSWPGSEVRSWIADNLIENYGFRQREVRKVIDADLILPIIDGLDEVDNRGEVNYEARSAELMRAIERFESGGKHCPVVVTCRYSHYQALMNQDIQPRKATLIRIEPVDAATALDYLDDRVASTPVGQARWEPIRRSLAAVAGGGPTSHQDVALADALTTPWRLTLVATVFQERRANGTYARDPQELLSLASAGQLYQYLLERFVSAAVASPHHRSGDGNWSPDHGPSSREYARLDPLKTSDRLTVIAKYLNANSSGTPVPVIAGRQLSGIDIKPHELWPMVGPAPRWIERIGATILGATIVFVVKMEEIKKEHNPWITVTLVTALLIAFSITATGRSWPVPQRIDFTQLRTRSGRRSLLIETSISIGLGALLSFSIALFGVWRGDDIGKAIREGLLYGSISTIPTLLFEKGKKYFLSDGGRTATTPRAVIRSDAQAWAALTGAFFFVGSLLAIFQSSPLWSIPVAAICGAGGGLVLGIGRASLRYSTFIICTRGKLPWRLHGFLDSCYQLGILRISGTAWQFRHRELQDHLAAIPGSQVQ
ncbi:NACHT domain-containing protein [Streptomyces sp. NPDC056773]|uniref:NACHT domain-containing protein n=1 Tax=unclassified Streptomyces TaxID=2593676 RepID=UPI0036D0803E